MAVHPEPKSLFGKDVKGALLRDSARLQVDQQEDLLARMRYIVGPYASRDFLLGALCSSQGRLGFAVNIYFREVVMQLGAEPPDWQWNPRRPLGNSGGSRAPALSALLGSTGGRLPQSPKDDSCPAKQLAQQQQRADDLPVTIGVAQQAASLINPAHANDPPSAEEAAAPMQYTLPGNRRLDELHAHTSNPSRAQHAVDSCATLATPSRKSLATTGHMQPQATSQQRMSTAAAAVAGLSSVTSSADSTGGSKASHACINQSGCSPTQSDCLLQRLDSQPCHQGGQPMVACAHEDLQIFDVATRVHAGRCLDLHDWVDRNSQGGDDKQSQAQRDACSPAQLHRDPQVGMQHPIPLQHLTGSAGGQNPGMPPKHFPSAPEMEVTLPSQHLPSQSCCQMDSSGASVRQAESMRAQHVPQQQPSKQDSQPAGGSIAVGLADLPQEVLEVILGHAGARAMCQAASTCKALCQAAASNEIWRGHTARRSCRLGRIVPIVYAFPSSPLLKAGKDKRVINGGDYLIASESVWTCNSCRARFAAFPFQDVLD
ncbi:hypothetical protein WJX74_004837 [Apatococcus lobatus]|uniref:F-box domain-containing protein n=1 Tax=Apatococcus lobatus TaxID=904363 RepID=A0AAW1SEL8_9CHLO